MQSGKPTIENKEKEHSSSSRPKEMSLETYKKWIRGPTRGFTSDKGKFQLTEQEAVLPAGRETIAVRVLTGAGARSSLVAMS